MSKVTHISASSANFSEMMLQNKFGVVTVMDAKVYDYETVKLNFSAPTGFNGTISENYICKLDTLKVANVTVDGPTKTITGGKYANTLLKYGKTARLEMQDALGDSIALEALCGGINEWNIDDSATPLTASQFPTSGLQAFHYGQDFASAKTIVGHSFFIDKKTGQQVKVKIVFYQFNPDSLFNLTQDGAGDASVFDMNGDLLSTDVTIHNQNGVVVEHGLFYSIFPEDAE